MKWISLNEIEPPHNLPVITRSPGYQKTGDSFETWREWKVDLKHVFPKITHWWDGPYDFQLAIDNWKD